MIREVKVATDLLRTAGFARAVHAIGKATADRIRPPLWMRLSVRRRLNAVRYRAPAEPLSFLWVDPSDIVYHRRAFVPKVDLGRVVGGDWDILSHRYENLAKHRALVARIERGVPWEDTGIYEYLEHFMATRNRVIDGCRTRRDMIRRYEAIDRLIESMRTEGFRVDTTVIESDRPTDDALDQIFVNIGREGDLIFNGGGHHRLSIAKVLGLERVPVMVIVRHAEWQALRDAFAAHGAPDTHPLRRHPDLHDLLPAEHP